MCGPQVVAPRSAPICPEYNRGKPVHGLASTLNAPGRGSLLSLLFSQLRPLVAFHSNQSTSDHKPSPQLTSQLLLVPHLRPTSSNKAICHLHDQARCAWWCRRAAFRLPVEICSTMPGGQVERQLSNCASSRQFWSHVEHDLLDYWAYP